MPEACFQHDPEDPGRIELPTAQAWNWVLGLKPRMTVGADRDAWGRATNLAFGRYVRLAMLRDDEEQ